MICPDCRRKPWYWADLSKPNEGELVYLCQNCGQLIIRNKISPAGILLYLGLRGGVRVLTLKLAERGYTLPPSKERHPPKAPPSPGKVNSAHPSRGEGS